MLTKRLIAPMAALALIGTLLTGCATVTGAAVGGAVGAGVGAAGGAVYDAVKK